MSSLTSEVKASISLLISFAVSLVILVAFYLGYFLAGGIVEAYVPLSGGFMAVWLPPSLICIAVSLLALIPIYLSKSKKYIPIAFIFLAVYAVVIAVIIGVKYTGDVRDNLFNVLTMYMILPAVWGNLISWAGYFFFTRNDI